MRGLEELVRRTTRTIKCATDQSLQDVDSLRIAELDRGSGSLNSKLHLKPILVFFFYRLALLVQILLLKLDVYGFAGHRSGGESVPKESERIFKVIDFDQVCSTLYVLHCPSYCHNIRFFWTILIKQWRF